MKKLLLLALTLGTAASLTACGSSTKEITNFLENHTNLLEESTVSNNYTVAYTTGAKTSTFNVDGNVAYNITSKDFYDINEDGTATAWINETYYEYTEGGNGSSGNAFLRKASLNATQFAAVSDNVAAATTNPFASLIAAGDDLTAEKLYKEFDSEKDENGVVTLFYVDSKEVKTAADSSFTVVFTYNLNAKDKETDEFATATVKTGGNTWVYSNLTNEDYENSSATAHSLTTPGETTLESIAALINARDNVNVDATLKYTDESDNEITENVTAIIDGNVTYVTSNVNANRYIVEETDGTFTVYTLYSGSGATATYQKTEGLTEVATLTALRAAMDITVDGTLFGEEVNVGSPSYRFRYTLDAMNATGNYVLVQASKLVNQTSILGTIKKFVSYDSTEGYTVSGGYTLNSLNNFADGAGLADTVATLSIISQDFLDVLSAVGETDYSKYNHVVNRLTDGAVVGSRSVEGYNSYVVIGDTQRFLIDNRCTINGFDDEGSRTNFTGYEVDADGNWSLEGTNITKSQVNANYFLDETANSYIHGMTASQFTYDATNAIYNYNGSGPSMTIKLGDTLADAVFTYQTNFQVTGFGTVNLATELANVLASGVAPVLPTTTNFVNLVK